MTHSLLYILLLFVHTCKCHVKLLHAQYAQLSGLSNPSVVGPRFWHSVVSFVYSQRLRQLVFFGGCPCAPVENNKTPEGISWAKLAATVMIDVGEPDKTLELFILCKNYDITISRIVKYNKTCLIQSLLHRAWEKVA